MDIAAMALAATAGQALVQAMVTDGWAGVRAKVARLLSRGNQDQEQRELDELDEAAGAVRAEAIPASVVAGHLQGRIQALLENYPESVAEIEALVAGLGDTGSINIHVGGNVSGQIIAGSNNNATFRVIHKP
ncbi:hypothetical protein ACIBK1_03675 [Microbispora rosea]|uniref:hypothetical protein n=1 Tax=Microbispora rosea TaxID=58117 RepID=UPI00055E365F|nr:hypothetical protein [Microbispora rosea]